MQARLGIALSALNKTRMAKRAVITVESPKHRTMEPTTTMTLTRTLLLPICLLAGLSQSPAWAHAALESTAPEKNAVLSNAPKDVTLRFNEPLEAAFSTIKLLDAGGISVVTGKAVIDASDPKALRLPVAGLKPGLYTVQWVAVGRDGHRRTGQYGFSLK